MDYTSRADYVDFVQANEPVINQIKEDDPSFFRLEKTYRYKYNDSMMFGYNGLTHYSSTVKTFVRVFMARMGFSPYDMWTFYNQGSTVTVDSFLGVKYLLTKEHTDKPYELLRRQNDIYVYQNPYALPLGFMVDEKLMDVSINESNLFELQNNIWGAMVNLPQGKLFYPADVYDIITANLLEEEYGGGIRYVKEDGSKETYIEYHVNVLSTDLLYAYFPSKELKQVEIFLNDESLGVYFNFWRHEILTLGNFEVGETIVFKMELDNNDVYIDEPLFYHQDVDVLGAYHNELIMSPFQIDSFTASNISGEITNPGESKKYALFTIPYSEDWKAQIDGKPVSTIRVLDSLIAIELPEGTSEINLKYIPGNLYLGITISSISFAIMIAWVLLRKRISAN
jgi:uncharacterized membrane protein YfhO